MRIRNPRRVMTTGIVVSAVLILSTLAGCETVNTAFPPETDFRSVPPEQILALLQNAANVTVSLSGSGLEPGSVLQDMISVCNADEDGPKRGTNCFNAAWHVNARGNNGWQLLPGEADFNSLMRGEAPSVQPDPREVRVAVEALLRGCGIYAPLGDEGGDTTCSSLGGLLYAIGNRAAAAAVWEQADGCYANDRGVDVNYCITTALEYRGVYASEPQRLTAMAQKACDKIHDRDACEFLLGQGQNVDMAAVENAEQQGYENRREYKAQSRADQAQAQADTQARRDAFLGALQNMAGNDPNGILNAGNQQAAAMRAIGNASAARQKQSAQPANGGYVAMPAPATVSTAATVSSFNTNAQANPPVATTPTAPTRGVSYLHPLASTCVRRFWDPQHYNWLSLENDCGQSVYVEFIFNHTAGWAMTGAFDLPPGAAANTGRSSSDINQGGGADLYVCPAGTIPVDMNGNILQTNVSQFQCRPQ
jgi:hypothetical protein